MVNATGEERVLMDRLKVTPMVFQELGKAVNLG